MARQETARHYAAFEAWYEADRDFAKSCEILGISNSSARNYAEWFGWQERADKRDVSAAKKAERGAIDRKAKMIEFQRIAGFNMRTLGMRWLKENEKNAIENLGDAVKAIEKGFALERQAEGLPDWVLSIVSASDAELQDEYANLLRQCAAAGGERE